MPNTSWFSLMVHEAKGAGPAVGGREHCLAGHGVQVWCSWADQGGGGPNGLQTCPAAEKLTPLPTAALLRLPELPKQPKLPELRTPLTGCSAAQRTQRGQQP